MSAVPSFALSLFPEEAARILVRFLRNEAQALLNGQAARDVATPEIREGIGNMKKTLCRGFVCRMTPAARPSRLDCQLATPRPFHLRNPLKTMNPVFSQIISVQSLQQEAAGPMFAELSTEETWRELLCSVLQDPSGDFSTQMTEIAALATWALESVALPPQL